MRPGVSRVPSRFAGRAGLVALLALLVSGCGRKPPASLSHTFESPEQAARAVLAGIAARNRDALLQLPIDAHEFRLVVWPELPSSRPEVGLPIDYAWRRLHQNSRAQLEMTLAEHGGRRYDVIAVNFRGERTRHASFTVHRETELVVRDPEGPTHTIRVFGSLLEREGRWKIFSYVVD